MKVAIVHDWLTGMRGGEKFIEILCDLFPSADIYTLVHKKGSVSAKIESKNIYTSFLQRIPKIEENYRYFLPMMPLAIELFDVKNYDFIFSSSHCVAKGVKKKPGALHICYCHTPMRYIYEFFDEYFSKKNIVIKYGAKFFRKYLQNWDIKSSEEVDYFITNSQNVQKRIKKYYNRDSVVIYPPVDTDYFIPSNGNISENFYLIVSAFAPYKRIDLAVEAFNILGYPLKIIGAGPEEKSLKKIAKSNIEFLGWLPDDMVRYYYQNCKALIFPGIEDLGLVPIEVQACGRPVIAYGEGGALETVIDMQTGVFFYKKDVYSLIEAVKKAETINFNKEKIRENALRFKKENFIKNIKEFVFCKIKEFDLL